MAANRLTPKQSGQLGGFVSARVAGHEGMKERGTKGGETTRDRHGKEHFVLMAHRRWNRLKGTATA